jgi:hypothetical protein
MFNKLITKLILCFSFIVCAFLVSARIAKVLSAVCAGLWGLNFIDSCKIAKTQKEE